SRRAQMLLNAGSFRSLFAPPEIKFTAFALLRITNHKPPQQIVEWLVLKGVLSGGDAERDVIGTRKRPRVTNPTGQEGHDGRRRFICRQWRAITKRDFHIRRRQRSSQQFRDSAFGA